MVSIKEEYIDRGLGPKKLFGKQETVQLYTKTWSPSNPDSIVSCVVFVHGIGEHCSRYHDMFSEFAAKGIKVASFDQR
jgi:alpha-beta hydrolase superfamily lysophospholipase